MKTLFVAAALLVSGGYALANTIVYDNTALIDTGGAFLTGTTIFDSFSTGGASGSLSGLVLGLTDGTPSDGGSITVALYADSTTTCSSFSTSDCPGSFVADIGAVVNSSLSTDALITVSLTNNPSLAAGTRYWIALSAPTLAEDGPFWNLATSASGTGVSGEFNGDGNYPYTTTFAVNSNSSFDPYTMQVTVGPIAAAPEPGPLWLCAGGLGGLLMALRRRRGK